MIEDLLEAARWPTVTFTFEVEAFEPVNLAAYRLALGKAIRERSLGSAGNVRLVTHPSMMEKLIPRPAPPPLRAWSASPLVVRLALNLLAAP